MLNPRQKALIMKDIRGITENKRYFSVLTIMPLIFSVIFPTMMILMIRLTPSDSPDFVQLVQLVQGGASMKQQELTQALLNLMMNNIVPIFFLIIPIMSATVMAASSFVGEKEKRTLETLFYSPLSIREIFQAKVYGSFIVGIFVTYLSFLLTIAVMELEAWFLFHQLIDLSLNWLWIMLLIVPAVTIISIVLIVRGSAKSTTIEEAQQKAAFLILPLVLLIVGQFTGFLVFGGWVVIGLGVVLCLIAGLVLKFAMGDFTYERLLD